MTLVLRFVMSSDCDQKAIADLRSPCGCVNATSAQCCITKGRPNRTKAISSVLTGQASYLVTAQDSDLIGLHAR